MYIIEWLCYLILEIDNTKETLILNIAQNYREVHGIYDTVYLYIYCIKFIVQSLLLLDNAYAVSIII